MIHSVLHKRGMEINSLLCSEQRAAANHAIGHKSRCYHHLTNPQGETFQWVLNCHILRQTHSTGMTSFGLAIFLRNVAKMHTCVGD